MRVKQNMKKLCWQLVTVTSQKLVVEILEIEFLKVSFRNSISRNYIMMFQLSETRKYAP